MLQKNQLDFNIAVRDWAAEHSYTITTTGTDEKIAIKFKDSKDTISDEELELRKTGISRHLSRLAFEHEISVDLDFSDLGYGDLAVFVSMKPILSKDEASAEYYDLLCLGPRMTADQLQRMLALKKRYGFI